MRNARKKELFDSVREKCEVTPSVSSGNRTPFVVQTVVADDEATLGRGPTSGAPRFVGNALAYVLEKVGPKGKEFGMYSLDYHTVRNFLYVKRHFGSDARANQHVPGYARRIVDEYNENGAVDARLAITGTGARRAADAAGAARPRGRHARVGDERDASPFGEIDPSVIGGVLGFVLVSAIASKVMGG